MTSDNPPANNDPVLSLNGVSKLFGEFLAVDDVSLEIPRGSIYGLLGQNGAGKTTTIRMILDIFRPTSGSISVLGASSALDVRNRIGYLPEEKGLYKKMKAWAVIQYFAMLKGMERQAAKERALELLEAYGLGEFSESKVESLSKGMGQKVQVLAAIAHHPEFVILDEPFSGLDPVNQAVLEELIRDMARNGQTILFSTHVMQHAERLCDRILLLAKGRKIFDGSVSEARACIPRRVILETSDDVERLGKLEGVVALGRADNESIENSTTWHVEVKEGFDPQALLRACFEGRINLSKFEFAEPSLHDVFVHLVQSVEPHTGENSRLHADEGVG